MLSNGLAARTAALVVAALVPFHAGAAGFGETTEILGGGASWSTPAGQVRVGDRVSTARSGDAPETQQNETSVDPETWREVAMALPAVSLRRLMPPEDVAAQGIVPGSTVNVDLPALGVSGAATVTAVDPSTTVAGADGRVVLATVLREQTAVVEIRLENPEETFILAVDQKIWSADRNGWVAASDVSPGEHLLRRDGSTVNAVSAQAAAIPATVVLIEVEGEGRCFVGMACVLASAGETP